ncbi:MAG TPA: efflux RND transporter periplasmic adaptor subunit [Anaerolineae bacterium]
MKARTIIIILIVIAVLGVGGYFIWQQQQNTAKAATTRQTATITRGSLAATVSGAGNLYAPQQTNLNFQLTGVPITKVNVQVGDKVKAGDVLAQVDDSDLQFSLRTAQSNLKSAQAKLTQTKTPASKDDVATAQAQVDSAQAAYDAAVTKYGHTNDQITVAKAALEKATITLQQAQAAYNLVAWRPDVGMSSQATTLQQATIDYQSALANYNLTLTGINDTSVKSAAQSLASARANLTKLIAPPTQQDLDIVQASVDNAQVAVDQAKRKLDQARIIAPFDGTVASVNYVVGQLAANSPVMMSLVNLETLQTQINLSEIDIAKIKSGQDVSLTFDALNRRSFRGRIVSISPVGTVTQGVVNYVVTVALAQTDPTVRPGMTAEATITVDRRDNALLVPNRAIKTQGNVKNVTLLLEGRENTLTVTTGLSNDTSTELLSATMSDGTAVRLNEGDVLVINPTTTTNRGGGGGVGVPGAGPVFIGR